MSLTFRRTLDEIIANLKGTCGIALRNLETGETYLNNDKETFPAASIIKLFILLEFFHQVDRGDLQLDTEVVLRDKHKVAGFGILKELHSGIALTYADLALLMIVLSDNVATNILIDTLGIEAINATARNHGFKNTILQRKMMDGEAKQRGLDNFTTPYDVLNLLTGLVKGATLSAAGRERFIDILKRQQCNNKLPALLPTGTVFAHKTGDLPGVEHDAGILYINGTPVVIVVMTKDLASNLDGIRLNNLAGNLIYEYFSN